MSSPRCLVFDTSSFIELRQLPKKDLKPVLAHFDELLAVGQLCYPADVVRELGDQEGSAIHEWAAANRQAAGRGVQTLNLLKEIYRRVPLVFDGAMSEGEEADGHVLAMAMHLRDAGMIATVVTEERKDKLNDTKRLMHMSIASACGVLELYCINVMAYLHSKGLLP